MKRRLFLTTAGVAGLGSVFAEQKAPAEQDTAKSAKGLILSPAALMAPRADGFEVVWAVSRLSRGRLEIRTAEGEDLVFRSDEFGLTPQSDRVLRVRVAGLKPGAKYTYRAITEAIDGDEERHETDWREAATLNPEAAETRFVVWNDTHLRDATVQKLHEITPKADFLVWNGDICNDWVSEDLFVPALLNPGGQDVTVGRPLAFVWGNHDVRGKYGFRFTEYTATPEGRPFYAFRSGPLAVVFLNTGEDKADDHPSFKGRVACEPLRKEQKEFLENVVLTDPQLRDAPYRLLICHLPMRWKNENEEGREYDAFSKRSRDLWHEALVKWGAQAVISGHTHQHTLIEASEGFPYAQLIGGGPQIERATFMEGIANADGLTIQVKSLEGAPLYELKLKPLA